VARRPRTGELGVPRSSACNRIGTIRAPERFAPSAGDGGAGVMRLMSERLRPDPDEFERSVKFLCTKIETVALRSGAADADCKDIEHTLAALPPTERDRVRLMLEGIAIQTEYDDRTMAFAARYLLRLALDLWEDNPHPLTHAPAGARSLSRPK
jgi:hypothetical protein